MTTTEQVRPSAPDTEGGRREALRISRLWKVFARTPTRVKPRSVV